jgi:hypothetical protein
MCLLCTTNGADRECDPGLADGDWALAHWKNAAMLKIYNAAQLWPKLVSSDTTSSRP